MGHLVHDRLDAPHPLGIGGAAEVRSDGHVGVDRRDLAADVGTPEQLDAGDAAAALAVRAHAADAPELDGLQRPVAGGPHPVVLHRRPAAVDAEEVVPPRQLQLDGAPRLAREERRDEIGVLALVLVAEPAAHVLADDAYPLGRQTEVLRHVGPAVRDALGRRPQGELVALPARHRAAGLHLRVAVVLGDVGLLDHHLGRGETVVHAAPLIDLGPRLTVAAAGEVPPGLDLDRPGPQGLFRVEYEVERLVVDLDGLDRHLGRVAVHGRHRGDGIPDEPDGVVEEIARVLLVAALPDGVAVLAGQHRVDTRHLARPPGIDAPDAGVGVGAAEHPGVGHPRQLDVARVARRPGDPLDRVDSGPATADHAHRLPVRRRLGPPAEDRGHVSVVVRAAAEVARHALPDLVLGGIRRGGHDGLGRHQLARRAESALRAVASDERRLKRIEPAVDGEPFDRRHRAAVGPDGELTAGVDGDAVEMNRARAALATVAADLGPRQVEVVAEQLGERPPIFDVDGAPFAVDGQRDGGARRRIGQRGPARRAASGRTGGSSPR